MKTKFTLLLLFISVAFLTSKGQQIPNGNFTRWTANVPDSGWYDVNQWLATNFDATDTLVSQDTSSANVAHGSTASAKLQTQSVYVSLIGSSYTIPAILALGTYDVNTSTGAVEFTGIPYVSRPDSFSFKYKYQTVATDTAQYGFTLTKWNGTSETFVGGLPAGYANFIYDTASTSEFHTVTWGSDFASSDTPDSLSLFFISGAGNSVPGNTLWVGDLEMIFNSQATDVENLNVQTRVSIYPVPAAITLHITVSETMLHNTYAITDLNGQVVARGTIESLAGTLNVSQLQAGTYIYTILDANSKTINSAKFIVAK